ncbi:MAG: dTMP kinase [Bacteroidales bacterium]|nr:dTMP kinase [Bacteroidales bacterium]MBK7628150.1 dTMP kinase [Bacteroidales bacterium]
MKLFVIEGVDGAGKSTQIKMLHNFFAEKGYKCEYLHFPRTDDPYFGELIARFLRGEFGTLNEVDPYLVAMLYAGDRKDASEIIRNWLKEGKIVLLDRYTYSNIAYQCAKINDVKAQVKLMKWILSLEFSHFAIPKPDLNIFLDVPFEFTERKLLNARTGDDRSYLNGTRDIHEESLIFQKNVRDIYFRVAQDDDRLALVDCGTKDGKMLSPPEIFNLIVKILKYRNFV